MVAGKAVRRALRAAIAAGLLLWPVLAAGQVLRPGEPEYLRLSDIVGREVHDARGEPLGTIKDLVIDRRTGKVEYVALEDGAFPVSALRSGEGMQLLLDLSGDEGSAAGATSQAASVRATELLGHGYDDLLLSIDGQVRFAVTPGGRVPLKFP